MTEVVDVVFNGAAALLGILVALFSRPIFRIIREIVRRPGARTVIVRQGKNATVIDVADLQDPAELIADALASTTSAHSNGRAA
jgi:hypothetical protein